MSSLVQLFIKLEWKVSRQYPLRIALNLFHILMILCLFFFISQTLGSVPFLKGTYFPFVATGLCFHSFFSGLINASPSKTLEWRDIGVLESLAMSPTPLWKLFLTAGSYEMLLAFMKSLFIFCGLFILADISVMPLVLIATIFMSFLLALSLSFISTCSFLRWKRVSLIEVGGSLFAIFLSGVYFPVDVLPAYLMWVAYINPVFHGLFLLRYSLGVFTPDSSFLTAQASFTVLGLWILVSGVFSFWFYKKTKKYLLKNNSLAHH